MSTEPATSRFSAKLLFQFRVDLGIETGKRRVCEERIVVFHAKSAQVALNTAKRRGHKAQYDYENDAGARVYFEFIGVLDLLELGGECESDEVWYDIVERLAPMERRETLIPPEQELCAFRNPVQQKRRTKHPHIVPANNSNHGLTEE